MQEKRKLIFVNTHPIQYYAPLYKKIHEDNFFDLEVWYCTKHGLGGELDKEFNTSVKWDVPVLEGYNYKFLKNISWKPGIYNGFFGVINLDIFSKLRKLPKKSLVVANAWNPFSTLFTIISSKILGHTTCLRSEPPLVHEFAKSKAKLFVRKLLLKNVLFKFVDVFLYIGTQNRKFYEYYGIDKTQLYFSPYSVNNEFFSEKAVQSLPLQTHLKKQLNIPDHSKVILYSGKLIPKKRPLDLLIAFNRVANNSNCSLIFIGDGELRPQLEKYIEENKVPNVVITGFVNQSKISEYYALAFIFVMCSDIGETWGLSTNEAMNFGTPVIISDKTGNFEDLVNGNGYVFETGNITDLANKLTSLLNGTPEEIQKKRQASISLVAGFNYDVVIDNLKKIN